MISWNILTLLMDTSPSPTPSYTWAPSSPPTCMITMPLNTVLWGCKSWSLTEENKRQLQVFHHCSLHKILNINMFEVKEQRITNAQIWQKANDDNYLRWIGKLARMPMDRLPATQTLSSLDCQSEKKSMPTAQPEEHNDWDTSRSPRHASIKQRASDQMDWHSPGRIWGYGVKS